MSGRTLGGPQRSPYRHRSILWITLGALLISLLSPVISWGAVGAADVAAMRAQDGEESPLECEDGTIPNESGTECIPDPNNQPPPLECDEGTVPNEAGTECVPDPNDQPPPLDCDEGTVPNDEGTECIPDPNDQPPPLECDEGTVPNDEGTECVPDPDSDASSELECDEGMVPNEAGTECVEDPNARQAAGPVYVLVTKYECPTGTDWYQATPDQFDECDPNTNSVTFVVTAPDGLDWTRPLTGGSQWGPWDPGDVTIVEEVTPDYGKPIVFCGAALSGETPELTSLGATTEVDWTLTAGETLKCEFYNIPTAANANTSPAANFIRLTKHNCVMDEDFDPETASYEDFQATCTEPGAGVRFDLEEYPSRAPVANSVTDANGELSFHPSTPARYFIIEELPPGYADAIAFCAYGMPDALGSFQRMESTGVAAIDYEIEFGYALDCHWFNLPLAGESTPIATGDGGGEVEITKFACPPDFRPPRLPTPADRISFLGSCDDYLPNITFELLDGTGATITSAQTGAEGTADWGRAVFSNVPASPIGIAEVIPDGYQHAIAFCSNQSGDSANPLDPVRLEPGSAITTTIAAGQQLGCDVFNIPDRGRGDDGTTYDIVFGKFLCAPGAPTDQDKPYYEQACQPAEGWAFTVLNPLGEDQITTDASGYSRLPGIPTGGFSAQEHAREGYGAPRTWCRVAAWADGAEPGAWGEHAFPNPYGPPEGATRIECHWYNFPGGEFEDGRITVFKYQCPPAITASDFEAFQESCTTPFNGLPFTLEGGGVTHSASTAGGAVDWLGLAQGTYTITEEMLPGYEQPRIWCGYVRRDGVEVDPSDDEYTEYPPANGTIQLDLQNLPAWVVCYWYNVPSDPGEITIYKWLCPPGYDLGAWHADPKTDCATAQDGVTFTLDQPAGDGLTVKTGDSIPGAATFSALDPGTYTVTEIAPPDTVYVFVLDCTGANIPKVHPVPLAWGNVLSVNVASGDSIVCNWYNVPMPDLGWITLYTYACWTPAFTSTVDCEIYEHGASMELLQVDGARSKGVGTTNLGGTYTWSDLEGGAYSLAEFSHPPCKMTASKVDGKGNAWVDTGQGTDIHVYTCEATPGALQPGKVPGKFPNTGVEPGTGSALSNLQEAPIEAATPSPDAAAEAFYEVTCLNEDELAAIGTPAPAGTVEGEATVPPIELEPTSTPAATESSPVAGGTPSPGEAIECERGAVPQHIVIDEADVDHDIEVLEIIDGVMEQPTGPDVATWYKETARLGETNNIVVAGHLNYWGVPEAVFFRLQDLGEGDHIELTGDDGKIYVYEVQWVRQESNLEPPGVDVVGPTDDQSLTLITCGGEWDASIAEYDERTVVRAVQVDVVEAEDIPTESGDSATRPAA